ncbi:GNAT family N-acetyltransferase [Paractinoplanes lichenicola]|uniref:GNAT family N-acetyltransferase n=1 Tax=Paractinoplanes lichenicola TaxID=2802976 RepID=A0ABS1W1Z0_9ACTN|nr:GNAT family N-acetyltransferase [Actinoplanes lichenicola]MBL7260751.1 GNAT family N-acetyltransferase [Actinoplanes lichenicola]
MTNLSDSQNAVQVRPRTDADVPECAALLREVYELDGYPVEGVDDATGWMYPAGLIAAFVAVEPGKILGHAAVCEPGEGDAAVSLLIERTGAATSEIAVLARLFVGPAARGKGAGRKLADAALSYATDKRLRAVFDVMEKDHTAISMYEKMGCVFLGSTSHHLADGSVFPARCYAAPGAADPR